MKKIRKPKELFEQRLNKSLISSLRQDENVNSKSILNPKIFFKEDLIKNEVVEDLSNGSLQSNDKTSIQRLIFDLFEDVDNLKQNINETKKYNTEINFIKKYIKNLEKEISEEEKFDPSNIYEGLSNIRKELLKIRSEIPVIPDPITYDDEFNELKNCINNVKESIPVVPEIKYYDSQINDLLEYADSIKEQIDNFPEIKYYDSQISIIEDKLNQIKCSIPVVPEIKYYDEDVEFLQNRIEEVKSLIPIVPEVRYYESEINNLEEKYLLLKETLDNLPELPEVKYYDSDVKKLNNDITNIRKNIKSLPEPKYYDEEIQIINEKLITIKNSIPEPQEIPEIKYYDEEIEILNRDISLLSKKISDIKIPDEKLYAEKLEKFYKEFQDKSFNFHSKLTKLEELFGELSELNLIQQEQIELQLIENEEREKEKLTEEITNEPPENKTNDPLTPLTQEFVTFKELREHYRLFINRIQQQLSTIGGGNEVTALKYLDDVVGIATNGAAYDGKYLMYDHSIQKFVAEDVIGESSNFTGTLTGLFDTDPSNLQDGYIMIYNGTESKFVFVDPNILGVNSDYNPDPFVDDYGTYN